MAPFNPDLPNKGDPSYLGMSQPISAQQPNTMFESLFKGVGNLVESGLKGADFLVKEGISKDIREKTYAEQQGHQSSLERIKGTPGAAAAVYSGDPMDAMASLVDAPEELPE